MEIPNSVTSIGTYAFADCSSLTSFEIPNSVTSIGEAAFLSCTNLASIVISNSVTSIAERTFADCSSLTSVVIPNSVTEIANNAFSSCKSLTSLEIGNSVTTIGDYAFARCFSLTSVEIPNSVTTMGVNPFDYCKKLESFTGKFASDDHRCLIVDGVLMTFAPAGMSHYEIPNSVTTIGEYAFDNIYFGLKSVTIPNSVTKIEDHAFNFCGELESVVIGSSVTEIGDLAFNGCFNLTEVISLNTTPPTLGEYSICYVDVLKVPAKAVEAYKEAEGWKDFKTIIGLSDEELEALTTGIPTLTQNPTIKTQNLFNLQGQKVGEDYKGIVIQGGRKVLKK